MIMAPKTKLNKFHKELKEHFKVSCIYQLFKVEKTASASEIKKAYYKLALDSHPDRASPAEADVAKIKFQLVGRAYEILSTPDKREGYDETGVASYGDDEIGGGKFDFKHYAELFRGNFGFKDLDEFKNQYQGSDEEKDDLIRLYNEHKGDMNKIAEHLFHYTFEDEDRVIERLNELIKNGDIPDLDAFSKEPAKKKAARRKKYEREAKEAEKAMKEMRAAGGSKKVGTGEFDLVATLRARQEARQDGLNEMIKRIEETNKKTTQRKQQKKAAGDESSSEGEMISGDELGDNDEDEDDDFESDDDDEEENDSESDEESEEEVKPTKKRKMPQNKPVARKKAAGPRRK